MKNRGLLWAAMVLAAVACKKDDDKKPTTQPGKYEKGVFVVNEGPFMSGSGTLDHYTPATKTVENNVFEKINNADIGNIFQSMYFGKENAYLIANFSGIIRAVDAKTLVLKTSSDAVSSPRFALEVGGNHLAVSDWAEGKVFILNRNTLSAVTSITVGSGPEQMYYHSAKNQLFVLNSGGFGADSTLSVIDLANNSVEQTLTLAGAPNSLVRDRNGKIWVLCGGIKDFNDPSKNTAGALIRINPDNLSIEARLDFYDLDLSPGKLAIDGTGSHLFYLDNAYGGSVYKLSITDSQLPTSAEISGFAYSLGIDPANGDIYTGDAGNFVDPGKAYRFNKDKAILDTLSTGIIPGQFQFRN